MLGNAGNGRAPAGRLIYPRGHRGADRQTETELDVPRARRRRWSRGAQLVDVRQDYEWDAGRIAGAVHIPLEQLPGARRGARPRAPVVFQCRTGAARASRRPAFREAGYEAYNLAGGIEAWVEQGRAIEPDDGEVADAPARRELRRSAMRLPARGDTPGARAAPPAAGPRRPRSRSPVGAAARPGGGPAAGDAAAAGRRRQPHRPPAAAAPRLATARRGQPAATRRRRSRACAPGSRSSTGGLGTRTYIAAAMTVLALAAAAVAIVLAVDARDNSASDDDLNAIESELSGIAEQAAAGAGAAGEIDALEARIAALESAPPARRRTPRARRAGAREDDTEVPPRPVDERRRGRGPSRRRRTARNATRATG